MACEEFRDAGINPGLLKELGLCGEFECAGSKRVRKIQKIMIFCGVLGLWQRELLLRYSNGRNSGSEE